MYRLGALDAGFLYNDTERSPQHIASVQIVELPEGTHVAAFVDSLKALLKARSHLVPYFRHRLQDVPFGLDHPVWVQDPNFDIDNHVHVRPVADPGDRAALERAIAALHATPLDRERPLWDLWVLTGLEGGRIAYYNRAHHACLDGMAGQTMIETIMDPTPEPRVVLPPAPDPEAAHAPGPGELVLSALENLGRYQIKLATGWMDQLDASIRFAQRAADPSKGLGAVAERAPRTRFNRAVGRERTFAMGELSLRDVKAIAKVTAAKVNDVFLAVCAGGLRRYLGRTGELPGDPLIAGCPVSLRQPGDGATNNQVTMMLVNLATAEPDPVKRLFKIALSSVQAKGFTADVASRIDSNVALPWMPNFLRGGAAVAEALNLADLPGLTPPCNVVISNVPGPREQLYSNGAKMLTHYPVSIAAHGQALNITVQSYREELFFAITACARSLPDAGTLRDDMLAAFLELRELVIGADALQQKPADAPVPMRTPSHPEVRVERSAEAGKSGGPEEIRAA